MARGCVFVGMRREILALQPYSVGHCLAGCDLEEEEEEEEEEVMQGLRLCVLCRYENGLYMLCALVTYA